MALAPVLFLATSLQVFGQYPQFLPKQLDGFVLSTAFDLDSDKDYATMRQINGGGYCVDEQGYSPHGYVLKGNIDLSSCAEMASQQPKCVGFKWGSKSFDFESYHNLIASNLPNAPVDLQRLFRKSNDEFVCEIYAVDEDGKRAKFQESTLTQAFGYGAKKDEYLGSFKLHKPRKTQYEDQGLKVCRQRWTLLQLFKVKTTEMWFCYTPTAMKDDCAEGLDNFYFKEGTVMIGVLCFFFGALAYVMANQRHFSWSLLWTARLLVNLELGMASVLFLMKLGHDYDNIANSTVFAVIIVVISSFLLLLPCVLLEHSPSYQWAGLWWSMVLSFSPCILAEYASYVPAFPLLASHNPMAIGLFGFVFQVIIGLIFPHSCVGFRFTRLSDEGKSAAAEAPLFYTRSLKSRDGQ